MAELRELIKARYGSEAKFAYKLGMSRQYMNRILRKQTVPNINEVADMAKELGFSINKMSKFFLELE